MSPAPDKPPDRLGRALLLLAATAASSLVIAACSGRSVLTPAAALPEPTSTPVPTFTKTAALIPTPTASATSVPSATPTPSAAPTASATPSATPTATATPCGETAGRVLEGTFPSAIQGFEQRLLLYTPPCYGQADRLYPTLYLFHGYPYTERHWLDLGVVEAADAGIASGELPPFLIVLPYGGELEHVTSGGDWSFEGVVMNELIPYIEATTCAWPDPAGRALGGISRGGYWSLEIAFRHPGAFVAVGGHSAALFPDNAGPDLNPLSTGADPAVAQLAIYMDIGELDWLRQGVLDLHDSMVVAGIPHSWQLNPGAHEDAYWAEHLGEYLAWYGEQWPADAAAYPSAAGRSCSPS